MLFMITRILCHSQLQQPHQTSAKNSQQNVLRKSFHEYLDPIVFNNHQFFDPVTPVLTNDNLYAYIYTPFHSYLTQFPQQLQSQQTQQYVRNNHQTEQTTRYQQPQQQHLHHQHLHHQHQPPRNRNPQVQQFHSHNSYPSQTMSHSQRILNQQLTRPTLNNQGRTANFITRKPNASKNNNIILSESTNYRQQQTQYDPQQNSNNINTPLHLIDYHNINIPLQTINPITNGEALVVPIPTSHQVASPSFIIQPHSTPVQTTSHHEIITSNDNRELGHDNNEKIYEINHQYIYPTATTSTYQQQNYQQTYEKTRLENFDNHLEGNENQINNSYADSKDTKLNAGIKDGIDRSTYLLLGIAGGVIAITILIIMLILVFWRHKKDVNSEAEERIRSAGWPNFDYSSRWVPTSRIPRANAF